MRTCWFWVWNVRINIACLYYLSVWLHLYYVRQTIRVHQYNGQRHRCVLIYCKLLRSVRSIIISEYWIVSLNGIVWNVVNCTLYKGCPTMIYPLIIAMSNNKLCFLYMYHKLENLNIIWLSLLIYYRNGYTKVLATRYITNIITNS